MRWSTVCLKCWKLIPHDDPNDCVGGLDCTDCPHCGNHSHGARQIQLGKPCIKSSEQEPPEPDTCHECGELAVGFDEGTPLCAAHYRSQRAT
jgi:hypothetical protein